MFIRAIHRGYIFCISVFSCVFELHAMLTLYCFFFFNFEFSPLQDEIIYHLVVVVVITLNVTCFERKKFFLLLIWGVMLEEIGLNFKRLSVKHYNLNQVMSIFNLTFSNVRLDLNVMNSWILKITEIASG